MNEKVYRYYLVAFASSKLERDARPAVGETTEELAATALGVAHGKSMAEPAARVDVESAIKSLVQAG